MGAPFFDEFTKQQIPASGKGVPEVTLSGSQVKNIQYAEVGGKPLLLDLYLPEKPEGSPLVIWVHGGGWKGGSKQNCFVKWLSNVGYTVASINYRLVDVAKWPAQLHDKVLFVGSEQMQKRMVTTQTVLLQLGKCWPSCGTSWTAGDNDELEGAVEATVTNHHECRLSLTTTGRLTFIRN